MNKKLLLAFYGDDFTGSTDALEFMSRAGAKTMLFIKPPTVEQLSRFEDLDAIGIAGMSRSMAPGEMEKELRPAFTALKNTGAHHVHYKVCSTFDSSPTTGSIGKAIDIAAEIFEGGFIPLLVAAPALGRYCAFGNLFARMGIGSTGKIHRLDRHPSMSKHPSTPADESDLRLHLNKQTSKHIGLVDILQIEMLPNESRQKIKKLVSDGAEIILFDCIYEEQLTTIGRLIDNFSSDEKPLFSVGSSGVEMALGNFWNKNGVLEPVLKWDAPTSHEQILVLSGSCSPVTTGQINYARSNGFIDIALDTFSLVNNNTDECVSKTIEQALEAFSTGKSVIIHTCSGPDDFRLKNTESNVRTAEVFGTALGTIARSIIEKKTLGRIIIAGGDTSGYAARAMGIEAVEMISPFSPGAPICKAYAPGSPLDGLQVNFKGGQVGREDYFEMAREGNSVENVF